MMDLLGSEYPTSSNANNAATTGDVLSDEEDQDEIQFRWGDGVLLSAIKEGHWLLIDEMNLA
jgi:midasin (ATPase involved in ribosome maturation)